MAPGPAEEDFGDEISLTSTDDECEGSEDLFVTEILAERDVDGRPLCLVQWHTLPVTEATWEPKDNLTDALMAGWEQTKADQRNGLIPKFNLQEWKDAKFQHYKLKLARHERRNLERARRGYPQTPSTFTLQGILSDLDGISNEEEQVDRLDTSLAERSLRQSQPHDSASSPANRAEKGISEPSTGLLAGLLRGAVQRRLSGTPGEGNAVSSSKKLSLNRPLVQAWSTSGDVAITALSSAGCSNQSSEAAPGVPNRAPLPHRTHTVGSVGYRNVFAGGRTRKGRGTLSEVASNPETHPKFLNSRLQRKIELQRRDKEGIKPPAHRPSALISLDHNHPQAAQGDQLAAEGDKDAAQASAKSSSKRKKGVHWEDELMDEDPNDSLFVPQQAPPPVSDDSNVERADDGNRVCEGQSRHQTISKPVQLGPNELNTITLLFNGLPPETGLDWAADFCSDERLVFTHTCTAQDYSSQTSTENGLPIVRLCEGTVMSLADNDSLANLSKNLGLGSLGLLCRAERYCVVMFPPQSHGPTIQGSGDATLQYTIFAPHDSLGPAMLAPAPQLIISDRRDTSSAFHPRPLDRIFGRTYEQLLPDNTDKDGKHNFFLAFPSRAAEEAALVSHWLRSCRSDSDIRSSYFAGHWASFSRLPHGVVIIHEDGLWFIRLFPGLKDLLHGRRASFKFWIFSRSLLPVHPFDSEGLPAPPLGDIHLQRIFEPGVAFLVTPSFFVSEPEQTYSFLKWFWSNRLKVIDVVQPMKLVLCARAGDWACGLALEKVNLRRKYGNASESELNVKGLSEKATDCRFKTFKLLRHLITGTTGETTNRILLAPESIDGNDEQSLVNWFGYWSILHIDRFRRYIVVGSGRQTEERLTRNVWTPNYKKPVIADPDELQSDPSSQREPPTAPRAAKADESISIQNRLYDIVNEPRDWCPLRLNWNPVGYSTGDVAFRLGDNHTSKYRTYQEWFNCFWKDFIANMRSKINSHAGLFYTFDERQASSCTLNGVRRWPWVAIFRAVNLHNRPWKTSELFIWDTRYLEDTGKCKKFCCSDLLEAQQALIEYVRERVRDQLPLEKVWVGAFGAKASSAELDATIQWLGSVLGKVKEWMPTSANRIHGRGWSSVASERPTVDDDSSSDVTAIDAADVNSHSEEDTSPPKIIFHPPRGNGQKKVTKCRNRLHQRARECDPKLEGKAFGYTFRPTMDWYSEQCEEGRGFEHVKVSPWHDVFQAYKIEESLETPS
ncbi:hypothetical protein Trco_006695 [Trichoderma cornu-damae]|uniref:Chromo domain-containing protein n=1 Tax=Trichoderma cornu-damae TaxID=654480 RepID=A0A9P8TU52_9HYPO|nr:hypothetical protein Trco_006695 [Trichoderma cornu-damae]